MRGALSTMNDEETGTDDESALHDKEEEGREEKTKKKRGGAGGENKIPHKKMRKMPVNEIDTDEDDDEGAAYQKERARQAKQGAISKRLSAPKAKKRKETGSKKSSKSKEFIATSSGGSNEDDFIDKTVSPPSPRRRLYRDSESVINIQSTPQTIRRERGRPWIKKIVNPEDELDEEEEQRLNILRMRAEKAAEGYIVHPMTTRGDTARPLPCPNSRPSVKPVKMTARTHSPRPC
ncbi:CAX-interacting protein 4-like [Nasonia vitripennis]|uniref:Uncharacterized protein n=1 Tax=Nasonia vitripennis TaxID=7425 RepID=A0A7M7T797_NASVI|nr:CAX-interacting protein 4-like [Nasonia vitripennis]